MEYKTGQERPDRGEDRRLGAIRQLGFSVNKLVDGNGYELSVDDCRRTNKDYFSIVGVAKRKLVVR